MIQALEMKIDPAVAYRNLGSQYRQNLSLERSLTSTLKDENVRRNMKNEVSQAGDEAHLRRLETILTNSTQVLNQVVKASQDSFVEDSKNLAAVVIKSALVEAGVKQ